MYLLGLDIGSSSIKAALLDAATGKAVASAASTDTELPIHVPQPDWAEQDPESWWREVQAAVAKLKQQRSFAPADIIAIGIAYQMHGLVCVDKDQQVLRPSIIWCDSRAVEVGDRALQHLGEAYALSHLLNAPGNFTASKLRWVRENEPETYAKIDKIMLPGDYIAMKLTGEACTTLSGLSEGIFWDFKEQAIAKPLLDFYGIDESLLSGIVPTFGEQGRVTKQAAALLGIAEGTPVTYRAGDQPNNAFSLNVLQPGEAATTAGTSGVVYAVHDQPAFDEQSRVNAFIHVNHTAEHTRNGVLMCLNGTGILNSWLKHQVSGASYEEMNALAAKAPLGAAGLMVYPFGNGVERILANKPFGGSFQHLNFNVHQREHLLRAGQEGIVYALTYGMDIMRQMGLKIERVRAGKANMFLSPLFREAFANTGNVTIELYNTDGALGAARAAGVGLGYYPAMQDAFRGMECLATIEPDKHLAEAYANVYGAWKEGLNRML